MYRKFYFICHEKFQDLKKSFSFKSNSKAEVYIPGMYMCLN